MFVCNWLAFADRVRFIVSLTGRADRTVGELFEGPCKCQTAILTHLMHQGLQTGELDDSAFDLLVGWNVILRVQLHLGKAIVGIVLL